MRFEDKGSCKIFLLRDLSLPSVKISHLLIISTLTQFSFYGRHLPCSSSTFKSWATIHLVGLQPSIWYRQKFRKQKKEEEFFLCCLTRIKNWKLKYCSPYSIVNEITNVLYPCSYHSLHHTEKNSNFCLFMPLYDLLGGTLNSKSCELQKEISSGMGKIQQQYCRILNFIWEILNFLELITIWIIKFLTVKTEIPFKHQKNWKCCLIEMLMFSKLHISTCVIRKGT